MNDIVWRAVAVLLGVIHHGLGNLAAKSIPAKPGTVIQTSEQFRKYMTTGEVPESHER